jgi:hypothetical protein
MEDFWKLAGAVFVGGLLSVFAWDTYQTARAKALMQEASEHMIREMQEIKRQSDAQTRAEQLRRQATQQAKEKAELERAIGKAYTLQLAQEGRALESDRAEAKKEAFKRYFKPSDACSKDPVQMDCANAFIVAKRDFETTYKPTF